MGGGGSGAVNKAPSDLLLGMEGRRSPLPGQVLISAVENTEQVQEEDFEEGGQGRPWERPEHGEGGSQVEMGAGRSQLWPREQPQSAVGSEEDREFRVASGRGVSPPGPSLQTQVSASLFIVEELLGALEGAERKRQVWDPRCVPPGLPRVPPPAMTQTVKTHRLVCGAGSRQALC